MTEAIWLTMAAAVAVTIVMSVGGVWLSNRSAHRIDRLRNQRAGLVEPKPRS